MVFPAAPRYIGAAGAGPDIDTQLGIAGPDSPSIRDPIIGGELGSVRLAVQPVADDNGERSRRVALLQAAEPLTAVVEGRERHRPRSTLQAVAQFIRHLFF